jgi:hypothetical protein
MDRLLSSSGVSPIETSPKTSEFDFPSFHSMKERSITNESAWKTSDFAIPTRDFGVTTQLRIMS